MSNKTIANMTVALGYRGAEFEKGMARARMRTNAFKSQMMALKGTMIGLFGIAGAASVMRGAVQTIANFDQAMADVKAILKPTNKEFEKLSDSAKNLGRTTKFTNSEVAALQKELGKLGFSTTEILNAQEAVLSLAAATGEDLAEAATVAGITVRQFGLNASETQRVVDVMAKSFTSSALDMNKFQESMKYVGPIAKSAGISLERATSMLAALADAGIDGSMAGTSLRMVINQLAKDGRPLKDRLGELAKGGLSFSDAEGEVGRRAQTALLVLTEQISKLDDLEGKFQDAGGSAKEMADVQLNTLIGKITELKSAWQGLMTEIGDKQSIEGTKGLLRGLADVINKITSNVEHNAKVHQRTFNAIKELKKWEASAGSLDADVKADGWTGSASHYDPVQSGEEAKGVEKVTDEVKKQIESINTLKQKIEDLEKLRDSASLSEVGNYNIEIEKLKEKLKYYQDLGESAAEIADRMKAELAPVLEMEDWMSNPFTGDNRQGKADLGKAPGLDTAKIKQDIKEVSNLFEEGQVKIELFRSTIEGMGEALGGVLSGQEDAWKSLLKTVLGSIKQMIDALLAEAIAAMVAKESHKGLFGLATASIGISGIMGLLNKIPKFAEGGIISGPTLGLMGEYPGASNNPEIVAPLSKLQSMLSPGNGQMETVQVEIDGYKMLALLKKMNVKVNS